MDQLRVTWDDFTIGTLPVGQTDEEVATLTVLHAMLSVSEDEFMEFPVLFTHFGIAGIQDRIANAVKEDQSIDWPRLLRIADWNVIALLLDEGAKSFRDYLKEFGDEHIIDEAYAKGYPFCGAPGSSFQQYVASTAN